MSRKSRLLNPSSTPSNEGKSPSSQSEKSSISVKTTIESDSLSRKTTLKGPPPISSQLSSLPPATPTRSLLHRIQRRSSTSAESISSNQSSVGKKTIKTNSGIPNPTTSTPIPTKTVNKSSSTIASVRGIALGESKLPRQRKSSSLFGKGNTSQNGKLFPGKIEPNRLPSQLAANKLQDESIAKRSSTIAVPRTSKGPLGTTNFRRHRAMIPTAAKISPPRNNVYLTTSSPAVSSAQSSVASVKMETESITSISTKVKNEETESQNSVSSYEAAFEEIKNLKSDPSKLLRDISENGGNGLTRLAARQLEHEFSSQERILEGLQRDNEHKTIEVEELKRKLARIEESCAKVFGKEAWRDMVYPVSPRPSEAKFEKHDVDSASVEKSTKEEDDDENPNDSLIVVESLPRTLSLPESKSSVSASTGKGLNTSLQKKAIVSHTRESSGVETITDRVNHHHHHHKRNSSSNTSLAMEDPSYYTAAEASSSSVNIHIGPSESCRNGTNMVPVPKDLLMALLQAQKQFMDHLHLDEDDTQK